MNRENIGRAESFSISFQSFYYSRALVLSTLALLLPFAAIISILKIFARLSVVYVSVILCAYECVHLCENYVWKSEEERKIGRMRWNSRYHLEYISGGNIFRCVHSKLIWPKNLQIQCVSVCVWCSVNRTLCDVPFIIFRRETFERDVRVYICIYLQYT